MGLRTKRRSNPRTHLAAAAVVAIVLASGLPLAATPAAGQDVYVDGTLGNNANPGTLAQPWRTIQFAVDQVGPGQTVFVRGGVYAEKVLFSGSADSGSEAGGAVVVRAHPGEQPILDGSTLSPSGRQGLFTLSDASHIRIEGFDILHFATSNAAMTPIGIYILGRSHHVEIVNNTVADIRQNNSQDGGAHGIAIFGTSAIEAAHDLLLEGNDVRDCRLMFSEALVLNGNVRDFVVRGNRVFDCDNIGFDFIGYEGECAACTGDAGENVDRARDGLVEGNEAFRIDTIANPGYGGERSAAGFYVDGGANIVFDRNRSWANNLGFELASEHFGKATEGIIVRNNFIYCCHVAGVATGGYSSGQGPGGGEAKNNFIVGNTLFENTTSDRPADAWGAEILLQSRNIGNVYKNNVVQARAGRPRVEISGSLNSMNVWGSQLYFGSVEGDAPGAVSLADPLLANPPTGDLHLTNGSPARELGESLPGQQGSVDFDGEARVQNASIDIGADELPGVASAPAETRSPPLLFLASPNPSNGRALLRFTLRELDRVSIVIVDASGRRRTTLIDEELPSGTHEIVWDVSASERRPAAGVYFALLRGRTVSATLRVLLVE